MATPQYDSDSEYIEAAYGLPAAELDDARITIFTDLDGRIRWASSDLQSRLGWIASEAVGRFPEEFLYQADYDEQTVAHLSEAMAMQEAFRGEIEWQRGDGTSVHLPFAIHPIQVDGSPVGFGWVFEGEPTVILPVSVEIPITTDEEAVPTQPRMYEETQAIAKVGSWELDLASGLLTWSDQTYRLFGLEPDGKPLTLERYLTEIAPQRRAAVEAVLPTITDGYRDDVIIPAAEGRPGRILRVIGRTRQTEGGRVTGLYGSVQDVTEDRLTEIRLQTHRQFLLTVIDEDPNLISVRDRHGRFILANRAFGEAYGVEPSDMFGKTVRELHPSAAEVAAFEAADQAILEGSDRMATADEPFTDAAGRHHTLQTVRRAIVSSENGDVQILTVSTDVTHRNAEAEPSDAVPAIDFEYLERITGGDQSFETELLQTFVESAIDHLAALGAARQGGDLSAVRARAHALKGSARSIGANVFGEICERFERSPDVASLPAATELDWAFRSLANAVERRRRPTAA